MTYAHAKNVLLLFFFAYVAISFGARVLSNTTEDFYPFFSWSLFEKVPPRIQSGYEIRVIAVHGTQSAPVPLADRPDLLYPGFYVRDLNQLSFLMGMELRRGDDDEFIATEQEFLSHVNTNISYELDAITYNPLERFLNGAVLTRKALVQRTVP